jgi:pyruvate/2-oxoglutarate dehydrogenase complex dihydrolipoamide acyltransferase (E2) component
MILYYYVNVPRLPPAIQHHSGSVQVLKYLVNEGDRVSVGTPLIQAENWWALMEFDAAGAGFVSKTFFSPGTHVKVGDPFAIIICDPEDRPRTEESCVLRMVENVRVKPDVSLSDHEAHLPRAKEGGR